MRRSWTVSAVVLLVAALSSVGCSLIADGEAGPGSGSGDPEGDEPSTGTLIIEVRTRPESQAGAFTFTGVPTGTVTADSTLVVSNLEPGTYTSTEVDPAPDFDVTEVSCDDEASAATSSGDPGSRTAVFNLEAGETVRCTFTNTQRGSLVVAARTEPDGTAGQFQYTGVPSGTIPANGTLVVANLEPGTYSSTERDPAPDFDVTAVSCDDGGSATVSSGDAGSRTAVFNLDPGEMVSCTFVNTRRGTLVVAPEVRPDGEPAAFTYTGVPTGTVSSGGTLVASNLTPGTYTTTEVDPAPDFRVTEVTCDDNESESESSGDAATRTAVFNVDPGEVVRCIFSHERSSSTVDVDASGGGGGSGDPGDGAEGAGGDGDAINPFEDPDELLPNFPLPGELPLDAAPYAVPKGGQWTVLNLAGQMNCSGLSLAIPAAAPETGEIEVLDAGQTLVGTSLEEDQTGPLEMTAVPSIAGRYTGSIEGMEEGVPVTIEYLWQVVTEEYIVGYLTSTFTSQGVSCTIYRPYELNYDG